MTELAGDSAASPLLGQPRATHSAIWPRLALLGSVLCLFLGLGTLWAAPAGGKVSETLRKTRASPDRAYLTREIVADDERCALTHRTTNDTACATGAPYLYISYHGGKGSRRVKNVCRYTRDGCPLNSVLLPSEKYSPYGIRGLMVHADRLVVAESYKHDSKILEFSECIPEKDNRREFVSTLVEGGVQNPGLIHPYGLAKRPDDPFFYVSAQDTRAVLRYHRTSGSIGPLSAVIEHKLSQDMNLVLMQDPDEKEYHKFVETSSSKKSLLTESRLKYVFPGTFLAFNNTELRGLTFDKSGRLYVAAKQKGVLIYNDFGERIGRLNTDPAGLPISVFYCSMRNSIWVGMLRVHKLYEYDATTHDLVQTMSHGHLRHPAGITTYGDSLYVLSQLTRKLLEFDMNSGKLKRVVLEKMPDDPERVTMSPC